MPPLQFSALPQGEPLDIQLHVRAVVGRGVLVPTVEFEAGEVRQRVAERPLGPVDRGLELKRCGRRWRRR